VASELVEVLSDWPVPPMPAQLVYPHRRLLSHRTQVFSVNGWRACWHSIS